MIVGDLFGGHVRLVFTLVLFIFILCVYITLTSFPEIPLDILASSSPEVSSTLLLLLLLLLVVVWLLCFFVIPYFVNKHTDNRKPF